jgi:hypothetical protein
MGGEPGTGTRPSPSLRPREAERRMPGRGGPSPRGDRPEPSPIWNGVHARPQPGPPGPTGPGARRPWSPGARRPGSPGAREPGSPGAREPGGLNVSGPSTSGPKPPEGAGGWEMGEARGLALGPGPELGHGAGRTGHGRWLPQAGSRTSPGISHPKRIAGRDQRPRPLQAGSRARPTASTAPPGSRARPTASATPSG